MSQTTEGRRQLVLVTTGGTIEKTYDEATGALVNRVTLVRRMLAEIRLEDTDVEVVEVMHKDSLEMDAEDRAEILAAVVDALARAGAERVDGVVVLHGTDTLTDTGEVLAAGLADLRVPVVLTGAIRPFEMRRSDALQNLTEAIFATGTLQPGVYVVAHGRALPLPGARKDRERQTFVSAPR